MATTVAVGSKQEIVLGHSARCEIIMTKENEVSSFKNLMQICKKESIIILLLMEDHAFVSVASEFM